MPLKSTLRYTPQRELVIYPKINTFFNICKTGGYNPNQDALHQLPRHQQAIIFHLRTDYCRLNRHFKRTGIKTSAQCPCGEADQTPEQYLRSCSLHQHARQQIWPTCVSLKTKLWGSAEDFFPDIQVCGTHRREDLVNATITSNAGEEEEDLFQSALMRSKWPSWWSLGLEDDIICASLSVGTGVALQADPGLAEPCAVWALEVRICRWDTGCQVAAFSGGLCLMATLFL